MKNLRIVFMGTPEFAVSTLGSLIMNGFNVVGVVTAPDKPSGRGRKITKSAVKEFAEFSYLPIMQPQNLKDPEFVEVLGKLNADLFIVVAFRMLPEVIWRMPSIGTINLHASLLPHYRGAAPVNHAIINGETVTGVTTFFIDDKIDTGNILLRKEIPIFPFENAGELHDRLMKHGARLVIKTLAGITDNTLTPRLQSSFLKPGDIIREAPKIYPESCIIDWNNDPTRIHNFIRGLSPSPGAKSFLVTDRQKISFKVFESQPESGNHKFIPGHIISDGKHFIRVACRNGFINIASLQAEGKTRLNTVEFLRGFNIAGWTIKVN
ncbi:MAG: methionyl-tRNA formyltransferase [Bacteroidales bacterium]|jgi:methionyl-tRNA formyltransferase|nr:methionyl-tRNA formyltransferase [Bacteroidales bacterium]